MMILKILFPIFSFRESMLNFRSNKNALLVRKVLVAASFFFAH